MNRHILHGRLILSRCLRQLRIGYRLVIFVIRFRCSRCFRRFLLRLIPNHADLRNLFVSEEVSVLRMIRIEIIGF